MLDGILLDSLNHGILVYVRTKLQGNLVGLFLEDTYVNFKLVLNIFVLETSSAQILGDELMNEFPALFLNFSGLIFLHGLKKGLDLSNKENKFLFLEKSIVCVSLILQLDINLLKLSHHVEVHLAELHLENLDLGCYIPLWHLHHHLLAHHIIALLWGNNASITRCIMESCEIA